MNIGTAGRVGWALSAGWRLPLSHMEFRWIREKRQASARIDPGIPAQMSRQIHYFHKFPFIKEILKLRASANFENGYPTELFGMRAFTVYYSVPIKMMSESTGVSPSPATSFPSALKWNNPVWHNPDRSVPIITPNFCPRRSWPD